LASILYGSGAGGSFSSPIKAAIKPAVHALEALSLNFFSEKAAALFMLIVAGIIIVSALTMIVKVMGKIVAQQEGHLLDKVFSKNAYAAMVFGVIATICAQSSSITTALLVPLAGSGLLTVHSVYPVTVGANIGTTATALLAAMTGNMAGLAIALVHLIFNLIGTLMFFVVPFTRALPIALAEKLANSIEKTKFIGFGYVASVFFILPISMIYLMKL
jgi:sodium-dependent phosphate cotransporter